jgi:Cu/Ag efflux protein CusF
MKNGLGKLAAAALLVAPLGAAAQAGNGQERSFERSRAQSVKATVEAIDLATRMVTLKRQDGKAITFRVDDRVKNLPQVKVGDLVYVDYYESVAIHVSKPDGGGAYGGTSSNLETAKPGEKPGGIAEKQVTLVATVAAIASDKTSVTLKGQDGTKVFPVKDPENLTGVSVGDQVTVIATQALAVSVEKAPPKTAKAKAPAGASAPKK